MAPHRDDPPTEPATVPELDPGLEASEADLAGLAVAGITRRRLAFLAAAFVTAWIVIVFARQAGEASAATSRLAQLREANSALAGQVAALEREYELIQRQAYVEQQARAYGLGSGREIAFSLQAGAPPLGPDAPGSAAVRLGAQGDAETPLESWLSLLFGPSR